MTASKTEHNKKTPLARYQQISFFSGVNVDSIFLRSTGSEIGLGIGDKTTLASSISLKLGINSEEGILISSINSSETSELNSNRPSPPSQ